MEELAPVDSVVVLGKNFLHFLRSEIYFVKIVYPSKMDSDHVTVFCWAKRNFILFNSTDFRDLDKVSKLVRMAVKFKHSCGHIFILYKELRLDLVTCRRWRHIWQEVVDFIVPHSKSRLNAWRIRPARHRMCFLD